MKAIGSPKSFIPLSVASALELMFHVMVIFHVNVFSCVLCKCVATSTTGLFSSWIAELLHQKHKNVLTTQQPTTKHAKEPQSPWFIVGRLLLITRSWLTHWNKAIASNSSKSLYLKMLTLVISKDKWQRQKENCFSSEWIWSPIAGLHRKPIIYKSQLSSINFVELAKLFPLVVSLIPKSMASNRSLILSNVSVQDLSLTFLRWFHFANWSILSFHYYYYYH